MVNNRDILKIILAYALFSLLWIMAFLGAKLFKLIPWIQSDFLASTIDLSFVVCSSLFLYFFIGKLCATKNETFKENHENAELLNFLIRHSSDSLVILNADGSQRYVSAAAEKITGFPAKELEGKTLDAIIHPEDLPCIRKAWHAAVAHPENTVAVEYRHKHRDGGWVYSEAVAQSFFDDPAINGMLATVRDTTARKVAEEFLRHQGALLEAMVRNIPFDFWARDTNGKIIIQSEQSIKLWGNLRAEPDTEALIPSKTLEIWQRNNAQVFKGTIVSYDCSLITKGGESREYHSIVAPIRDGAEILGIMGVNLDITEERQVQVRLRESEERLQLVMEGSQLGYWDWDIKHGGVKRNKRWAEMLGYTQKEIEESVKQWTDLHHPDDREAAWESIGNHLQGRSPAHRMEYRMLAKDGQYKWILDQASVTKRDNDGTPLRMSGTHTDITQYKQKEFEREKLQSQLAQAQKLESIGRLAGGVAHDFNNMLSVILGYTEMCLAQISPENTLWGMLQEIEKAGQHSASITRQLLAFARKQTTTLKILDLNETVEGMLRMLRRLIGENIRLSWQPGYPLKQVKIDPSQVDQILANLCVNARDAISGTAGTGKIEISTSNVSVAHGMAGQSNEIPEGEYVRLTVTDNGVGMDQKILPHLFEPFFTTKEVGEGTGLGLATVYGIVKQNNGSVQVRSALNQGTTFEIYFPASESIGDADKPGQVSQLEHTAATVLLVEDEPAILEMATLLLESLGYSVLAANLPSIALQIAQKYDGRIDLLITDVVMPEMDGPQLAQKLLVQRPELRQLFMSGYSSDVMESHGMSNDNIHFMHKPFTKISFEEKICEALA